MLNAIWAVMILLAVIYGAITGHMSDVTDAALDSAGEAISLCITMAGVVALWMGLMEIADKAGLVEKLKRGISPFMRFMCPRIPEKHPARGYIATNIIANVLGLGWACTPAGLKAMEELAKLEAERGNPEYLESRGGSMEQSSPMMRKGGAENYASSNHGQPSAYPQKAARKGAGMGKTRPEDAGRNRRASNEMCTFLILNISSLQLIPVNMIAYRAQYGSADPAAIIVPAIAATLFSSFAAVVYCKLKDHGKGSAVYYRTEDAKDLKAAEILYGGRENIGRRKVTQKDNSLLASGRKGRGGKVV